MEKRKEFSPHFPLHVTPAEVSGRCRVLGPGATKLGEPGEDSGREQAERQVSEVAKQCGFCRDPQD